MIFGTTLSIIVSLAALGMAAAMMLSRRQRSLEGLFFALGLISLTIVEGADRLALTEPLMWQPARQVAMHAEACLGLFWLLFALSYARKQPFSNLSPVAWIMLVVALLLPLTTVFSSAGEFYFSPDFADEQILFLNRSAYWMYFALLVLTVAVLYHLERTLRALPSLERSALLYEILGVGIVMTALLIFYSQSLLHRTLDMTLVPMRSFIILIGLGLCIYSRFRRRTEERILVSRDVASRSVVVLVVACYLMLLGGAGQGLRYFGLYDQRPFYIGFAVVSGLLVVVLLLSEKNRRKLKVFLHKHFYQQKYDYRNEWLMFTRQLSSASNLEKIQGAILTFYCDTFARKGAVLYLRDTETGSYQQKASHFLDCPQTCLSADHPLVNHIRETAWVFSVDDSNSPELEPVKQQFKLLKVELCVPLQYEQDLEGFVLLGEAANPGEVLSYEDFDLMKVLASQATSVLLSMKLSEQLTTAQEMAAIGRVSTFVIHDLKNQASNLSLMMDNAREHINNPEFQGDMLDTLDETIGKMNGLIERLRNIREKKDLNLVPCDLAEVVRSGVKAAGARSDVGCNDKVPVCIDVAEIEKVVHNMVLNACEAGAENGSLKISVGMAEMAFFEIADRGCGMSDDFIRNRLFRPFQTTKQHGFGIGLYQCRHIIEAHGGRVEVASKEGEWTSFKVFLPASS